MTDTPYPDEMFEEAARREAANKAALESLGIEYGDLSDRNLGMKDDVDYQAPNGDYIKVLSTHQSSGGNWYRMDESLFSMTALMFKYQNKMKDAHLRYFYHD
jgi:hypothetical protein